MKKQRLRSRSFWALGALSASACYPVTFDDAAELDMVVTRKSPNYDYSKNRTYAVPPEVVDLCEVDLPGAGGAGGDGPIDVGEATDCVEVSHAYDDQILNAVHRNMQAFGYEEVSADSTEVPDVVVFVGTVASNNWVAFTYYPWWGYYPYYGYDWWSYYYGWYWYYPTTTVVNFPTGTVMMQMVSLKDADAATERLPGVWTGAVRGLRESSAEMSAATRITGGIDQAFSQSPYLEVGSP